jgi:hypothetical protein
MFQGDINMSHDEFIYNWENSLRKTNDGATLVASRTAEELKEKGYSASEISDIMIADNHDMKIVEAAVRKAFRVAMAEDSPEKETFDAYVTPSSYDDVKPFVEKTLSECSAREFMNRLAKTKYPILKGISDRTFDSLVRMAEIAKESKMAMGVLHADLSPFFESAMYDCVKTAEDKSNLTTISDSGDDTRYAVAYNIERVNQVDISKGTCDCDKYVDGHYADFGLACEHIISAANNVSPNSKLLRTG